MSWFGTALAALRPPQTREDAVRWRWRVHPPVLLFFVTALFVAVVLGVSGERPETGGDFPAFYAAGVIVNESGVDQIYDFDEQARIQTDLPTINPPGGLPFVYPPVVAVAFAPLARFGYSDAYLVWTMGLLAVLIAAIKIGWDGRPLTHHRLFAYVWLALAFTPILRSVVGSQLTVIFLALLVAVMRLLEGDDDRSAIALVPLLVVALLKPQIGLPLVGLLLLRRTRRETAPAMASLLVFWIVNAAAGGPGWLAAWLDAVEQFNSIPEIAEFDRSVSWLGVLRYQFGSASIVANGLGWFLNLSTVGLLVWLWRPRSSLDVRDRMSVLIPGLLLLSPYTIFYDAGLLLLPMLHLFESKRLPRVALLGFVAASWAETLGWYPLVHPTFPLLVAAFLFVLWTQRSELRPSRVRASAELVDSLT